jgi:uncharacterized protein HemY
LKTLVGLSGLLMAALLLSGCPSPARRPSLPPPASPTPGPSSGGSPSMQVPPSAPAPRPPAPPRENHLSPATHSLVTQARALLSHGDFNGASSTLDRALHIEPNNPLLWIEMGRVRLVEGDAHQAEGCGRKALALASGDRSAQRQAGRVLADALRAQGRNPEAQAVESQPFMN